jgi:hypothetical protein
MTALTFAMQVLNLLPSLIEAGVDVYDLVNKTNASLKQMQDEKRDPNDAEWDALNQAIEELRAQRPDVDKEN